MLGGNDMGQNTAKCDSLQDAVSITVVFTVQKN